jgi:hypothetical protein
MEDVKVFDEFGLARLTYAARATARGAHRWLGSSSAVCLRASRKYLSKGLARQPASTSPFDATVNPGGIAG